MARSTLSTLAELILVDTRASSGIFLLPEATASVGRKLTILDAYGTFSNSTVQIQCSQFNTIDTFEDGLRSRFFSTVNTRISFIAASTIWYCLQSNTSGGFNSSNLFYNLNSSPYTLDINSLANVSTFNTVNLGTTVAQCNMWVASGTGAVRLKYSLNNGLTWLNCTENFTTTANAVAFNGFMWVAVGNGVNSIQYSYNGINWSNCTNMFASSGNDVKWGGRYWVACGPGSSSNVRMKWSLNGINWSDSITAGIGAGSTPFGLSHNGKIWVVSITDGNGASPPAAYSFDGSNWIAGGAGMNGTYGNYTRGWDGDVFRTMGWDWNFISSNGINWFTDSNIATDIRTTLFSNTYILSYATNGEIVVYLGGHSLSTLKYSKDRYNFFDTNLTFRNGDANCVVVYSGSRFIATGSNGTGNNIAFSDNGITWTTVAGFDSQAIGMAFSSNAGQTFQQSNFNLWGTNYAYNMNSTNNIHVQPSTILINNCLSVDAQNSNVYINTKDGRGEFTWDVNGPMRHSIFYSSITAGGTLTITPGNAFGVHYDITNTGTYTVSLSNVNNTSNIGKFYVFQNNTSGSLSLSISGGSGIGSPVTIPRFRASRIMVASATTYALF